MENNDVILLKRDMTGGSDLGKVEQIVGIILNGEVMRNVRSVTVNAEHHSLIEVTVSFLASSFSTIDSDELTAREVEEGEVCDDRR